METLEELFTECGQKVRSRNTAICEHGKLARIGGKNDHSPLVIQSVQFTRKEPSFMKSQSGKLMLIWPLLSM